MPTVSMRLLLMTALLATAMPFESCLVEAKKNGESNSNETKHTRDYRGQIRQENLLSGQEGGDSRKALQEKLSKELMRQEKELHVTRKDSLKKEWCRTEPIVQRIKEKGCSPRTVVNRFCYGQCNSFYIGSEKGSKPAFKSCAICRPKKATWVTIKLYCGETTKMRRVYKIKQCRCLSDTD